MFLRFIAVSAFCLLQDPPKPPDQGTPPAKPAAAEAIAMKADTLKRAGPDGVTLTGDFYTLPFPCEDRPTVVCFHMENGSRAEFAKIAPLFAEFACCTFAVDLRSGKETGAVANETAASAASVRAKTTFTNEEAFADVVEALKWTRELRPNGKIFALGSGTSAALVLVAAGRDPACADLVLAFSPGEDVPGWSIARESKTIRVPVYLTCDGSLEEVGRARRIGNSIDKKLLRMILPIGGEGAARGSAVLIQTDRGLRERHWSTVVTLLLRLAPIAPAAPAEAPLK